MPALLPRVLGDPERATRAIRPTRSATRASIIRLAARPRDLPRADDPAWALHFKPLIIASNYFYGSLHFIVTGGVTIYLYRKWSDDYPRWRNTLGIATGLALIGFIFFPLMPPRLLPSQLRLRRHPGEVPDASGRSTPAR